MTHPVLVADIGGTSSRLALVDASGGLSDVRICRNDAFPGFMGLIESDLEARGLAASDVAGAVLAVAGPADEDRVKLTNRDWAFSRAEMRARFGWRLLGVLNDFEALAHGVPALAPGDLAPVGAGHAIAGAPILVCGPGTGFGVAGLIPFAGGFAVVTGEGGLVRLGATTTDEARLLAHLTRAMAGPVAVEHALSGAGLARIHHVFTGDRLAPEAVIAAAIAGADDARESCDIFLRLFGRIAGDLSLIFNARGGVFLAGGVAAGMVPLFADSPFRQAFEEHPPHQARLRGTAVNVITLTDPTPGLIGAGQVAVRLLAALE